MRTSPTPPAQIGDYTVLLAERHEVLFKDDEAIGLYRVADKRGLPQMYLRCFTHDELHAVLVDLRHLARSLGPELPTCRHNDVAGLVAITLRMTYPTAAEFRSAALLHFAATAPLPKPDTPQLQLFGSTGGGPGFLKAPDGTRRFWPVKFQRGEVQA